MGVERTIEGAHEVTRREDGRMITQNRLRNASVERPDERMLEITGNLSVAVTHRIELAETGLEETLAFENRTDDPITIGDVACGLTRTLTSAVGEIDGALVDDRFIAIPFRHRPDAPMNEDQEYTAADLLEGSEQDHRVGNPGAWRVGEVPSGRWGSEAWAWDRDDRVYLVGMVNDEFVEQSVLVGSDAAPLSRAGLTGGDLGRKTDLEQGGFVPPLSSVDEAFDLLEAAIRDAGHEPACDDAAFAIDIAAREAPVPAQLNDYGVPLDNRESYTKLDWEVWAAMLVPEESDAESLFRAIRQFLEEMPDRVPLTDWYDTRTAEQQNFQHRSVVGMFLPLLDLADFSPDVVAADA